MLNIVAWRNYLATFDSQQLATLHSTLHRRIAGSVSSQYLQSVRDNILEM